MFISYILQYVMWIQRKTTVHAVKSNLTLYNTGKETKVANIYKTDLEGHTEEFQTNMERTTGKPVCINFQLYFYNPSPNWYQEGASASPYVLVGCRLSAVKQMHVHARAHTHTLVLTTALPTTFTVWNEIQFK